MNERIQALAKQAEILFYKGRIPETGYEYEGAEVTKEDLQKFAELIVLECVDLLLTREDFGSVRGIMRIAGAKLKQHFDFGVDE